MRPVHQVLGRIPDHRVLQRVALRILHEGAILVIVESHLRIPLRVCMLDRRVLLHALDKHIPRLLVALKRFELLLFRPRESLVSQIRLVSIQDWLLQLLNVWLELQVLGQLLVLGRLRRRLLREEVATLLGLSLPQGLGLRRILLLFLEPCNWFVSWPGNRLLVHHPEGLLEQSLRLPGLHRMVMSGIRHALLLLVERAMLSVIQIVLQLHLQLQLMR